jgi:hypothetical protein
MVRFPELHLSVVVLFNHFMWGMRDYALQVADLFLEDKTDREAVPEGPAAPDEAATLVELSSDQGQAWAGIYFNAQRVTLREVTFSEGRLQFLGLDLVPLSGHRFVFEQLPDSQVEFLPASDSDPTRMKVITPSGEYGYDLVKSVSPSPKELAAYAGRYYSPELDISSTLVAADDHLVAQRRKYVDSQLTPLFRDAFSDDWLPLMGYPTTYLVVFERNEHGAITGLRVSGTRVRNLWFARQDA